MPFNGEHDDWPVDGINNAPAKNERNPQQVQCRTQFRLPPCIEASASSSAVEVVLVTRLVLVPSLEIWMAQVSKPRGSVKLPVFSQWGPILRWFSDLRANILSYIYGTWIIHSRACHMYIYISLYIYGTWIIYSRTQQKLSWNLKVGPYMATCIITSPLAGWSQGQNMSKHQLKIDHRKTCFF